MVDNPGPGVDNPPTTIPAEATTIPAEALNRYIGGCIRAARRRRGWTQLGLAEMVGISRSMMRLIERGTVNATMVIILALMSALGIPVTVLDPATIADALCGISVDVSLDFSLSARVVLGPRRPRLSATRRHDLEGRMVHIGDRLRALYTGSASPQLAREPQSDGEVV
jgi:transcriptional regulator with XRE-family HTH domain